MVSPDSVNADRPVGKPYLEIRPDRDALARYGVPQSTGKVPHLPVGPKKKLE